MKGLFFFAITLVSLSGFAADNEKLIISEKLGNIPKGGYWIKYDLSQDPVSTSNIRVELTGNYCGPTFVGSVNYTSVENQSFWQNAQKTNKGTWELKGGMLYKLNVLINQPKFKYADCTLQIFASTLLGNSSGDETFIGVIEYQGGYNPNLLLPIYPARKVKSYRVSVPDFCKGVEILETGVTIEGTYEKAKVMDKALNTFSVNDGHGLVVGGIELKMNGPMMTCTIPIFIRE